MISVRLDIYFEKKLSCFCLKNSISKSEVVRKSLSQFLKIQKNKSSSYEVERKKNSSDQRELLNRIHGTMKPSDFDTDSL